jgi:Na+/H+-dicarboxylate symporter
MAPATPGRARLALHWWILIALGAGAIVGSLINAGWTSQTWAALGVHDPKAFLAGTPPALTTPVADATTPSNDQAGALAHAAKFAGQLAKFVGDLFVRLLRMIAAPVVLFSLIAAVAGVGNPARLGRLGARTIGVFALTAVLAVLIAMAIATLVRPGSFVAGGAREQLLVQQASAAAERIKTAQDFGAKSTWASQLLDVVPANPFQALATANMMQIVVMSVLLGIGLTLITDERRRLALSWSESLAEGCLKLVGLVLKAAPIAVFCLAATTTAGLGWGVLAALSVFVVCVLGGLAVILLVEYPLVIRVLTPRGGPALAKFFRALAPAQLLAFSSSSSAATMPVTMACCKRLRIPDEVTNLVCPLGTTINMDGTALYQVLCVTFLAQLFGVDLSVSQHVTIGLMSILVAIGSPGLPGASLALMVFILEAVRVPIEGIGIILAVDRVLDMARTVVNVTGDAAAAVVVAGGVRDEQVKR